ncbi:MAG: hypothetical protein WB998_04550, partial [Solirubrobacteraceae bacterium]
KWGTPPSPPQPSTTTQHVTISGSGNAVALGNSGTVNQVGQTNTVSAGPGYEELSTALKQVLEFIRTVDVDADDKEVAEEFAQTIQSEVAKPSPDRSVLKRATSAFRGIAATAVTAATTKAVELGIQDLIPLIHI